MTVPLALRDSLKRELRNLGFVLLTSRSKGTLPFVSGEFNVTAARAGIYLARRLVRRARAARGCRVMWSQLRVMFLCWATRVSRARGSLTLRDRKQPTHKVTDAHADARWSRVFLDRKYCHSNKRTMLKSSKRIAYCTAGLRGAKGT